MPFQVTMVSSYLVDVYKRHEFDSRIRSAYRIEPYMDYSRCSMQPGWNITVSYTHLDVYKRQILALVILIFVFLLFHMLLDTYKRYFDEVVAGIDKRCV